MCEKNRQLTENDKLFLGVQKQTIADFNSGDLEFRIATSLTENFVHPQEMQATVLGSIIFALKPKVLALRAYYRAKRILRKAGQPLA